MGKKIRQEVFIIQVKQVVCFVRDGIIGEIQCDYNSGWLFQSEVMLKVSIIKKNQTI